MSMRGVYLVTDRRLCGARSVVEVAAEAAAGGARLVQLREKELPAREVCEIGRALKQALTAYDVPLIINDRVDIALAIQADGVHLGQQDLSCRTARTILGPRAIIGVSVETLEDVREALAQEPSYIALSPVFPTATKTDTNAPWGLAGLARVRRMTERPLAAIGGIDGGNIGAVLAAGADLAAVVSAICAAESPRRAAAQLAAAFE